MHNRGTGVCIDEARVRDGEYEARKRDLFSRRMTLALPARDRLRNRAPSLVHGSSVNFPACRTAWSR